MALHARIVDATVVDAKKVPHILLVPDLSS